MAPGRTSLAVAAATLAALQFWEASAGTFEEPLDGPLLAALRAAAGASAGREPCQSSCGPTVAPEWSADLLFDGNMMGMIVSHGVGRFLYDRPNKRSRTTTTARMDYFRENGTFSQDQLMEGGLMNFSIGVGSNGTCMPFGGGKMSVPWDTFGWTVHATWRGRATVGGEACDLWATEQPYATGTKVHLSACIGADLLPRIINSTVEGTGKFSGSQVMRFSSFSVGAPGDDAFAPSWACANAYPAPPCESRGTQELNIYRIWGGPPEPLSLENRDTGDVLGDLSFVCTQGAGAEYESKLITRWLVNVSTDYGQYAICNFDGKDNVCNGRPEMLRRVGRRFAQMGGTGPHFGQCSPNADVGSQYSFPTEAKCPPGVEPGAGRCAWAGARAVRTIRASCVTRERGLLEACRREVGHAPFLGAAKIWEAAFASGKPELGGCPDAAPSSISVLV